MAGRSTHSAPHGGREKHLSAFVFLAGLSAVVFWLCPLRTGIQVLVFVASIAVVLICHVALTSMPAKRTTQSGLTETSAGATPAPELVRRVN